MSTPLGGAVGNAVEVAESVEVLAGGGPADVVELTLALAREMVALAGLDADPAEVLGLRPGDGRLAGDGRRPGRRPGCAAADAEVPGDRGRRRPAGVVTRLDALAVGMAAWRLGAGRARKEHAVQPAAGILCLAKPGDGSRSGEPLFELHTDTPDRLPGGAGRPGRCGRHRRRPAPSSGGPPLVLDVIRG